MKHAIPALLLLGSTMVAAPAMAQDASAALTGLYKCADMTDPAARLACFDGAVASLRVDESEGEVAVVTREQVVQAQRNSIGRAAPTIADVAPVTAAAAKVEVEAADMQMAVTSIYKGSDGKFRFEMANGQIWRQTDNRRINNLGDGPWTAEVKTGAMGSYFVKVDDKTAVRAKRAN